MSDLADLTGILHELIEAIQRPADHPPAAMHAAITALTVPAVPPQEIQMHMDRGELHISGVEMGPADPPPIPEPDTPAVFPAAPAPLGTESHPEDASFPVPAPD